MKWWKYSWAKSLSLINSLSLNNSNCNTIYTVVILKVLTYSELNYHNFCFWETDWLKWTNGQFKECSGIKRSYVTYCWLSQTSFWLVQKHIHSNALTMGQGIPDGFKRQNVHFLLSLKWNSTAETLKLLL